jgi:hypothetical protein
VATYSTGITVTWDGTDFVEVTDVSYSYGGSRTGRDTAWSADQGSVNVTCLGTTNVNLSTYAIWQTVGVAPAMNDVTRYTVTFRIVDN